MHDPRVLLDPATDAVRKLARRGYALDVAALEKLLSARNAAIQRGDEARAESKRVATVGEGRRAPRSGRRWSSAPASSRPSSRPPRTSTRGSTPSCRSCCSASRTCPPTSCPTAPATPTPSSSAPGASSRSSTSPARPRRHRRGPRHPRPGARHEARRARGSRCCAGRARSWSARSAQLLPRRAPRRNGYTEYSVPTLVNRPTMTGTGQLPKFEQRPVQDGRRRPRAVPDPHRRGAAHQPARQARRWPLEEPPAGLHRAHAVLPLGGGLVRQGHPRADPHARVRQGGARAHRRRRRRRAPSWRC